MHVSLSEIEAEWQSMRRLTLDLLDACSQKDLDHVPIGAGPVWKQFRHIAGIHEVYLNAIETGHVSFNGSGKTYAGDASVTGLRAYFEGLAVRHAEMLSHIEPGTRIDWFGEPVSISVHLMRLIGHETLHHGQFILQWRARGIPMPPSWQAWGV